VSRLSRSRSTDGMRGTRAENIRLGHPHGILPLGRNACILFGMTTVTAAVDGNDAVIATDGLMEEVDTQGQPIPYSDQVVKIMALRDSLLVGFMANSLMAVRSVQLALAPSYTFDWSKPETFCAQWNGGSRRVFYGYRNAVERITKALRGIKEWSDYSENSKGMGIVLVGRRKGRPAISAWETSQGCEPREIQEGVVIGSKPAEDRVEELKHLNDLMFGDRARGRTEDRLVAAIRYCAVDLHLPHINGNVATCRLSERGKIRWHLLSS